jgi:hypothetical protein
MGSSACSLFFTFSIPVTLMKDAMGCLLLQLPQHLVASARADMSVAQVPIPLRLSGLSSESAAMAVEHWLLSWFGSAMIYFVWLTKGNFRSEAEGVLLFLPCLRSQLSIRLILWRANSGYSCFDGMGAQTGLEKLHAGERRMRKNLLLSIQIEDLSRLSASRRIATLRTKCVSGLQILGESDVWGYPVIFSEH